MDTHTHKLKHTHTNSDIHTHCRALPAPVQQPCKSGVVVTPMLKAATGTPQTSHTVRCAEHTVTDITHSHSHSHRHHTQSGVHMLVLRVCVCGLKAWSGALNWKRSEKMLKSGRALPTVIKEKDGYYTWVAKFQHIA